jgi:hypothetical protein
MAPRDNKLVADFLARQAGDDLLEALSTLAGLKFPIPDQLSFEAALEPQAAEDRPKKELRHAFGPQDFPILSPQSALEKYYAKLLPIPPALSLPPRDLPDFQERPDVCGDIYDHTFVDEHRRPTPAAGCACRAFRQALREGFTPLQAMVIGHFAGRRMERTGSCPV